MWGNEPKCGPQNPYLDEVMGIIRDSGLVILDGAMDLDFTVPPEHLPGTFEGITSVLAQVFTVPGIRHRYSFSIPTEEVLTWMVGLGPIIEVGAGKGYWARMISDRGGDVIATDVLDPSDSRWTDGGDPWHEIVIADHTIAEEHGDRVLFLCWPMYESEMATEALLAHRRGGGRMVVYVGEGEGGCTASDSFFGLVGEMEDITPEGIDVLRWYGIHDHLWAWRL